MSTEPFVFEPFDLPDFEAPQKEHWPAATTWDQAIEAFEATRGTHASEFDSPESRLRAKNPEPFRLD